MIYFDEFVLLWKLYYISIYYWRTFVRWARLGELNYLLDTDNARPMDYQIEKRVVHPNYQPPSLYNDIALFRLDQDVKFSAYVRPICLNADPKLQSSPSQTVIATGWGQIHFSWFIFLGLNWLSSRAVLNR